TLYLRQMGQTALLTPEEEIELAEQIERGQDAQKRLNAGDYRDEEEQQQLRSLVEAGQKARERLIQANTRLVVSIAKRYRGLGVPFSDLIQEGNIGLIRAVERFDPSRGNRFSTYATWWIRQAIVRAVSNLGRTIRLPVHAGERARLVHHARNRLYQLLGRQPTEQEIADELGISPHQVYLAQAMAQNTVSLDQPVGEEDNGESSLADFIVDENTPSPLEQASQAMLREDVRALLRTLKPREARVLSMRFGLDDGQPRTLEEVAEELGVTRERVRQIETRALRRLRHPHNSKRLRGYYYRLT
ncbi:MAG TPA: sigma-70 family RNA polymerase sigma factor, partial [Anaerolineae bacterium]|nr:sigma-70 family RNA polymerase sigma factor [Anaerolineae bacterium]